MKYRPANRSHCRSLAGASLRALIHGSLVLALVPLAFGCAGDGDSPAPGSDGDSSPPASDGDTPPGSDGDCRALGFGRPELQFNLFQQLTGVRFPIAEELGGAGPDALVVELYDSTTPGLPPLTTGTFDLSVAPDDNLGTCQHCVSLRIDLPEGGMPARWFYQEAGQMTVSTVEDPLGYIFAGTLSAVTLREVTVDESGVSTPVADGSCYSVSALAFDTNPTPGADCLVARDCGNVALEVCDPATGSCAEPQCGEFFSCPLASDICRYQTSSGVGGACYSGCEPFAASVCDPVDECVQLGVSQTFGICLQRGDAALGAGCTPSDVGSGCAAGAVCDPDTRICMAQCPFFTPDPGCAAGSSCSLFGRCESAALADPASIGGTCASDVELAHGCGDDGAAFRGICFSYFEAEPKRCERACLTETSCATDEFCALRFSSGLGICQPNPVCGDGELGEVGEVCDDGNTESGDGCSGDCQAVEYGPLCAGRPALPPNGTVSGTTVHGVDGFTSSCQLGTSRGRIYALDAPGPGRLTLTLTSATDQGLSVWSVCDDSASELGCQEREPGGVPETLIVQLVDPVPATLTVLVSALTILELGPFTLSSEFVPEDCGDGVVAGREVCDDGNTESGDGCSGDCLAIEYEVYCAAATPLVLSENVGDTSSDPMLYDGSCESPYGTGRDRLYRFIAPYAGTLTLRLDQGTQDLGLYVLDGCAAPGAAAELGCSSVWDVEEVVVTLAAGQSVTVVVDGFRTGQAGPYVLTASF